MAKTPTVEQFLDHLSHPRKDEILRLRRAILGANSGITEQIKWNAPSFCINGDDRVTFRLQPKDVVELVLHRGAKKRTETATSVFTFDDPAELVRWRGADRGIVAFADRDDVHDKLPAVVDLVDRWMKATAD